MKKLFLLILILVTTPLAASAQAEDPGFSRQGIFGCSRNAAALSGSVGSFSATGGVFVPVADFTTELNTGTLVYQQCVLRGIVNRQSESVNGAQAARIARTAASGCNGGPCFASRLPQENLDTADTSRVNGIRDQQYLDGLPPEYRQEIQRAEAIQYTKQRQPTSAYACDNTGQNLTGIAKLLVLQNPNCDKIIMFQNYDAALNERDVRAIAYRDQNLDWGRGFLPITQVGPDGETIIVTPASVVEEQTVQALTSGFRRIENANDIDQMVGALYAGLGVQALTGSGGLLSGLTTPIGNLPSYLSQMSAESSAGLVVAATNAALQALAGWRNNENQYNSTVSGIANALTQAATQLRSVENQCWNLIAFNTTAKHVCVAAPVNGACTDAGGNAIKIATSTQFSQPIVDAQIVPLANQVIPNIQKSQQALTLIDQLIAAVSNTAARDAQRLALIQLDQLVSQGKIHQQADVTAAQQQLTAVNDAMTQLIEGTKTTWADNTDAAIGWCNVNNQAVIDFWDQKWR